MVKSNQQTQHFMQARVRKCVWLAEFHVQHSSAVHNHFLRTAMLDRTPLAAAVLCVFCQVSPQLASAQTAGPLCQPSVTSRIVVVSPAQRQAGGNKAEPPLTDTNNGFAWPDTPMGMIKTGTGYEFFASDGGYHSRQM